MSKKSTVTEGRDIQFSMQLPGQLMCAGFSFHLFIFIARRQARQSITFVAL